MATSIKISQLPEKGANLEATDLLEVSEFNGTGYVSKSITGQEIIDSVTGGGVTNITTNAPLSTTGGTTPDLSISEADASTDGFITAVDWNTFNNKQEALVSGTNIKTINGSSVLGSGDLVVSGGGASGINNILKPISTRRISYALSHSVTGATFTLARLTLVPFTPVNALTISEILMYCNILGVGSLCRLLIYSDNNGFPDAKLYESADLNLSTVGFKIATTTFTFNAGTTYWLGFHGGGVTANVMCNNIAAVYTIANLGSTVNGANGYNVSAALGSAPANITSANLNTAAPQWIGLTPA
jgi:hypothetical protein